MSIPSPLVLPELDIVVAAGQSNATAAHSLPDTVEDEDIDPRIHQWNGSAIVPMRPAPSHQNIGTAFAQEYVKQLKPDRGVLVVNCGRGTSGFSTVSVSRIPPEGPKYLYHVNPRVGTWDPALGRAFGINHYNEMIAGVQTALGAAPSGSRIIAVLWSAGEADYPMTRSEYEAKLDDMIGAARAAWHSPTLRWLIGSQNPDWLDAQGPERHAIEAALADTPRRVERTAYCWGPENLPEPGVTVHWSPQGQRTRGRIFLRGWELARLNVTGAAPQPPQNPRAWRSGTAVYVTWEHPPSRFDSFTLEYRVNGGAWTELVLAEGSARAAVISDVEPKDAVGIRLRTTNSLGDSVNTREICA